MSNVSSKSAITDRAFRDVMGLFATGVTVLTTDVDGETIGMTANAIASVSLEPMLILVCVQKEAMMAEKLQQADGFAINILSEAQQPLSNYFAGFWPAETEPPQFSFEPWGAGSRLAGALGGICCTIDRFLDGGDHWIITGLVIDLFRQNNPDEPLLYYRGQYRRLKGD